MSADLVSRYRNVYEELSSLLSYGIALIEAQAGHKPANDREFYAERIFGKLVCHGLSLKRLSPSPEPVSGRELWDISSSYAIARTLIETYEALAYIATEPVSEQEREFRIALWKLHSSERRAEMLRLIGSKHPDVPSANEQVTSLRAAVLDHPFLSTLSSDLPKKIKRGEAPPYHLARSERDRRCGIDHDYHTAVTMHLSSHVHTHPFSVYQLFEFRAGDPECLRLMLVPIQYSLAFLAKAIQGMKDIFSPRVPPTDTSLMNAVDTWTDILRKAIKNAG